MGFPVLSTLGGGSFPPSFTSRAGSLGHYRRLGPSTLRQGTASPVQDACSSAPATEGQVAETRAKPPSHLCVRDVLPVPFSWLWASADKATAGVYSAQGTGSWLRTETQGPPQGP